MVMGHRLPQPRCPARASRGRAVRIRVRGKPDKAWLLLDNGDGELCASDPGHGEDLTLEIRDTMALARWHLGHIKWGTALRSGGIVVHGPTDLRRALPTWNLRPRTGRRMGEIKGSPEQVADFVYGLTPANPTG